MAERSLNHLNYGHPGVALYDLENRAWSFARQHAKTHLKQVNSWKDLSPNPTCAPPASTQNPTSSVSTNVTGARKRLERLIRDYPQIAPASALLPELAVVSAAILSTTSTYDPLVGSLFSLGSITFGDKWDNPRRVAALPAGGAGNVLRLALLVKERHGWGVDKSVWLEGLSLTDGPSGYWNEEAAPIQQVCFAQSDDKSSFLAVRLPSRTVFFRPKYHQRRQPARPSQYYDIPSSVVDAQPILSIELEQSGGAPHADVTFNPDFQLQCGMVDQQNTWSVWDIDYARKGSTYSISCLIQGHIVPPEDSTLAGEDGWARILWVGDVNTLLVCNRRHLSLVSIRGDSYERLQSSALLNQQSSEWILDVKNHPRYRNRFFVLTSARLFLMAITTSSEALDATAGEAGAVSLISWRHYRGSEDFTLQMTVQMLTEDEAGVLLYSRVNDLIQLYIFHQHASGAAPFMSSSDPITLKLASDEVGHIKQLHLEPLYFGERGQQGHKSGPGRLYMETDLRFYQLFVTLSDLSVREVIVYAHESDAGESGQPEVAVDDIMWSNVIRPRKEVRAARENNETDHFVVADGPTTTDVLRSKMTMQVPESVQAQGQGSLQKARDYRLLHDALTRKRSDHEATSESIGLSIVTTQLEQMLVDDAGSSPLPVGTLMEFAGLKIDVPDVDEASSQLHALFPSEDRQCIVELQRIASVRVLELVEEEACAISTLYDAILQNWIAPLPIDVPIRVRQHKERLARRIAAEVMLASTCIRRNDIPIESQSTQSQGRNVALPILASKPVDRDQSQCSVSQSLPSVPPYSSSQPHSSPATPSLTTPPPSDPLARLSKYLDISRPSSTVPHNVNNLLAHWHLGADPRTYDWDTTEHALRPEKFDEVSQEQREKARKRQERREKRQKREDDLMKAKTVSLPSVEPGRFPRSSPGPMLGNSSQFPFPSQVAIQGHGGFVMPQSQVEPGRFGGRPDKKKKKGKGRISGF
ncbi:hypothetical protein P153DRAFT_431243 [Dothidotthia symphoricarpi CBS 119687]|uniref:RNA polymerase I-specific transcription initiation factor RRN6-like protein n=1 Tax=Dothidotthia symphoricarpi CBS 119687 TaxID=1392245 RepID=A0A6A6ABD4_9PLEO|nr:uncharacterized protein P153DRAFT_431243 [Dothidotthia symphoricarpi CBS 119687]KAF2129252.1 hypothetical protein P153DRAFT_431243 [Dothidotthia symphoricarpi CBS 119687]